MDERGPRLPRLAWTGVDGCKTSRVRRLAHEGTKKMIPSMRSWKLRPCEIDEPDSRPPDSGETPLGRPPSGKRETKQDKRSCRGDRNQPSSRGSAVNSAMPDGDRFHYRRTGSFGKR